MEKRSDNVLQNYTFCQDSHLEQICSFSLWRSLRTVNHVAGQPGPRMCLSQMSLSPYPHNIPQPHTLPLHARGAAHSPCDNKDTFTTSIFFKTHHPAQGKGSIIWNKRVTKDWMGWTNRTWKWGGSSVCQESALKVRSVGEPGPGPGKQHSVVLTVKQKWKNSVFHGMLSEDPGPHCSSQPWPCLWSPWSWLLFTEHFKPRDLASLVHFLSSPGWRRGVEKEHAYLLRFLQHWKAYLIFPLAWFLALQESKEARGGKNHWLPIEASNLQLRDKNHIQGPQSRDSPEAWSGRLGETGSTPGRRWEM